MNAPIDPTKTKPVAEFKHDRQLMGCRFDPEGKFVYAWGHDFGVHRWRLGDGKKSTLAGHESWVSQIAFAAGGKTLWSVGYDGRLIVWPIQDESPKPSKSIAAHDGWARCVSVSPDGSAVATGGNDNLVKLWSTADGSLTRTFRGHARHVYKVLHHPQGKRIASVDLLGVVKDWDVAAGKSARDLDAKALWKYDGGFQADIGGARGAAFSADGNQLACSGITDCTNAFAGVGKPLIILLDWPAGKQLRQLRPAKDFQGVAWGVCLHPAGWTIGLGGGGSGGALWFWRAEETASSHFVQLPSQARGLDLHPDGKRLAVAFADRQVRIYSLVG